jgi:hypothetical protein
MNFSYGAVWADTLALLRSNARLLAAVAGVFLFLPAVLVAVLFPEPQTAEPAQIFRVLIEYYSGIWHWLLLKGLCAMIGGAAMLRLVLKPGTSVGGALTFGVTFLPFYFLVSLGSGLIIGAGCLLLVVPGLYLFGRLIPAIPLMVAENLRNPAEAISRSFEITKGHGWAVFGLVFIVAIVAIIVAGVAIALVGIVLILAAGQELGTLLATILSSALDTGVQTLLLVLYAAIYRGLTQSGSLAATFD